MIAKVKTNKLRQILTIIISNSEFNVIIQWIYLFYYILIRCFINLIQESFAERETSKFHNLLTYCLL